ncbi:MAG: hypothetical protein HUU01_19210 [Saprospiraceae bacterium]|nr:hypothetical protein [Saprospiraceae bacterium]
MKQTILTLLIPVHLFSAMALNGPGEAWIKLPSLLRHFSEHRLETPGLSFFAFLEQHYGEAFSNHQNAHDHSDLPMKNLPEHGLCCTSAQIGLLTPPVLPRLLPPDRFTVRNFFSDPYLIGSCIAFDIWQPPKSC